MRSLSLSLALASLVATPALAETAAQRAVTRAAAPAAADLKTGVAGSGFIVTAGDGGGDVAVTVARSWDSAASPAFNNLGVKLSAPLDKDAGEGNFLLDDGLAGGTAVEVSFKRVLAPAAAALDPGLLQSAILNGRRRCADATPDADEKTACAALTLRQLEAQDYLLAGERRDLQDAQFLNAPIWMWGVTGAVGHDRFDYRDPTDFSEQSGARTPWSVSLNGGVLPKRSLLYLGGGYEYKRTWKDAKKLTQCQPAGAQQDCVTAPVGRPKRQDTSDLFAVVRYKNELAAIPYGLELKAAYDFEEEISAATASLYFVGDGDGNLRGGLRAGWQSDDDDPATDDDNFTIGVFIGAAFSVF